MEARDAEASFQPRAEDFGEIIELFDRLELEAEEAFEVQRIARSAVHVFGCGQLVADRVEGSERGDALGLQRERIAAWDVRTRCARACREKKREECYLFNLQQARPLVP